MDGGIGVDHYAVLGFVFSGEEGAKLSKQEITRAYRLKAKEVHPDKRPGESSEIANSDFVGLQNSYELLMDDNRRKLFDDRLRINRDMERERVRRRQQQHDRERRSMWSDFKEREPRAAVDPEEKAREDEKRRREEQLDRGAARIRAMFSSKRKTVQVQDQDLRGKKVIFFVSKRRKELENLAVGARFQDFENSVLEKLRRSACN